ncbi:MAG: redox-regulated ATPase YchF [Desulfurococcales archaeon]|nr:redox-regulated ATPase YchF [Desulfurococcales archaeon]
MPLRDVLLGVVGKTNVGKSTFFAATTETVVEIENRPFTTINPNIGISYVRKKCIHIELGLQQCNPRNSMCIEGNRFIPVKLMDVAGLVPGAHMGRGLGNKFLDDIRQADAILLVVDASGSTSEDGVPVKPGSFDPIKEVNFIINEIDMWIFNNIKRDWEKFSRTLDTGSYTDKYSVLAQRFSGFSIRKEHIHRAFERLGKTPSKLTTWSDEDLLEFVKVLREESKPLLIIANKADHRISAENIKRLQERFPETPVIPVSSIAELALRHASKKGLVKYIPGDPSFKITWGVNERQREALESIKNNVLLKWGSTGVQKAINTAVFDVLDMITVYPVEDATHYTDKEGRVLPDAFLVPRGTTAREFAYLIHTDLGEGFLYAVNAKTKQRIGENYVLKDNDVVKIVSTL